MRVRAHSREKAAPGSRDRLVVSVAVTFADSSIVVLALPELFVEFPTTIPRILVGRDRLQLAVVVGAFALLPFVRRVRPAWLVLAGLVVFLAASVVCALADSLEVLVGGEGRPGNRRCLLLAASLPLLVVLSERSPTCSRPLGRRRNARHRGRPRPRRCPRRGLRLAGDLRRPGAAGPRRRSSPRSIPARKLPPSVEHGRAPLGSASALVFTYAALVGALFLSPCFSSSPVGLRPARGSRDRQRAPDRGSVRAAALGPALRPGGRRGGSALLAAGLAALALLPANDPAYAVPAAGARGRRPRPRAAAADAGVARAAGDLTLSGATSVGFATSAWSSACSRSRRSSPPSSTTRRRRPPSTRPWSSTPSFPLTTKVPITLDLYREFQRAPEARSRT